MPNQTLLYVLAAAVGAVIAVVVGYFVFAAAGQGISINYWLRYRTGQVATWAILGALIGMALRLLRR